MYCKNCGNQINDNSNFCEKCEQSGSYPMQQSEKSFWKKKYSEYTPSQKKKFFGFISVILVLSVVIGIWIGLDGGSSNNKKLEIIGTPTMTVDYNEYLGYSVSIKGQAKNNGGTTSYVSVTFNLYNASGHIIGSVMDNHNTLGNGAIWNFNATVGYYGRERPVRFELADITRF